VPETSVAKHQFGESAPALAVIIPAMELYRINPEVIE
jgi:hypothetical protein